MIEPNAIDPNFLPIPEFATGGVAIGVMIWLMKYFMDYIKRRDEQADELFSKTLDAVNKTVHAIEKGNKAIDENTAILKVVSEKIKEDKP